MKDRITAHIFSKAEREGVLKEGMTVVAASSGNTGCSVAMMCAIKGYKAVVITNEKCSGEKRAAIKVRIVSFSCVISYTRLTQPFSPNPTPTPPTPPQPHPTPPQLQAYGAELIISDPDKCYMQMETDLAKANPAWFSVDQYNNLNNPEGHYRSTAPEIWRQTDGEVTHFVAAGSTGGTISGIGSYLKETKPSVNIVLADPTGSVFKNYFKTGEIGEMKPFLVEGVGKNNIPGAMDFGVIDGIVDVNDKEAIRMCRTIASRTGLCVGGSSGLNVEACARIAEESDEPAVIVTMLCDSGIKYLSKMFNDEWLQENGLGDLVE